MKKLVLSALALVVVLSGGLIAYNYTQDDDTGTDSSYATGEKDEYEGQSADDESKASDESSEFVVSTDGKTVAYDGRAGETALYTLKDLVEVETEKTDFGEMVVGINGVQADAASEYWAFYVNGELGSVGAGTYVAEDGDMIEWQLTGF